MAYDYKGTIEKVYADIRGAVGTAKYNDHKTMLKVFELFYSAVRAQIHGVLAVQKTKAAEMEIREIIAKYVIGKTIGKQAWIGAITLLEERMRFCAKKKLDHEITAKYTALYDSFFALAAFRSLKHYALYLEFDKSPEDKIWANTLNCFGGMWYYVNKMVLDGSIRTLTKQMPTGYGKSYSDTVIITWILGQSIDNDIMKGVGVPKLIPDIMTYVINIMTSKRYAKVFPYFEQFDGSKDRMFNVCQTRTGDLVINGSTRAKNLLAFSKETEISGTRFKYMFFDDITCAKDASNDREHDKDWSRYVSAWVKRNYDNNHFYQIASGTAYSPYDFLSKFKEKYGFLTAKPAKINKYTHVSESGENVFVIVPLLDYETDTSTYELKFPTALAKADREDNYPLFMAMCQQTPLAPEDNPFFWDKLQTYDTLPNKVSEGGIRSDYARASIDLARKGKNYTACAIMSPCRDIHYFVDCVYKKAPVDQKLDGDSTVLDLIVDKLIYHNVTELVVENNTNSMIQSILQAEFDKRQWSCKILTNYSTENKEARIHNEQGKILDKIRFPRKDMFAESSDMGLFMRHLATYSYNGKDDDGIDAVAQFSKFYINKKEPRTKVEIIYLNKGRSGKYH